MASKGRTLELSLRQEAAIFGLSTALVADIKKKYAEARKKALALAMVIGLSLPSEELNDAAMLSEISQRLRTGTVAGAAAPLLDGETRGIGPLLRSLLKSPEVQALGVDKMRWVYGLAPRKEPFLGHKRLDGKEFSSWTDDVLKVPSEFAWIQRTHFSVSDHYGCLCRVAPIFTQE